MLTSLELYYELKLLVNKSGSASGAEIERSVFVWLYNREAERWLSQSLTKKSDSEEFEDLEELLETDVPLERIRSFEGYTTFKMPGDWFRLERVSPVATRGCSKLLNARPVKPRNLSEILQDPLNNPSFDWEETVYIASRDQIKVYQSDFSINRCNLTYYRLPRKIDLEGYRTPDNSVSTTIDPDISSVYCRQILDRVAKELARQWSDPSGHPLSAERLSTAEQENF